MIAACLTPEQHQTGDAGTGRYSIQPPPSTRRRRNRPPPGPGDAVRGSSKATSQPVVRQQLGRWRAPGACCSGSSPGSGIGRRAGRRASCVCRRSVRAGPVPRAVPITTRRVSGSIRTTKYGSPIATPSPLRWPIVNRSMPGCVADDAAVGRDDFARRYRIACCALPDELVVLAARARSRFPGCLSCRPRAGRARRPVANLRLAIVADRQQHPRQAVAARCRTARTTGPCRHRRRGAEQVGVAVSRAVMRRA